MAVWCNGWNTAEPTDNHEKPDQLMVQARPNRARLSGAVERISVTADCPTGWSELTLRVAASDDVDDMANMLQSIADSSVGIHVRSDDVARAAVAVGDAVMIDAKRVSPRRIVGDGATLRHQG